MFLQDLINIGSQPAVCLTLTAWITEWSSCLTASKNSSYLDFENLLAPQKVASSTLKRLKRSVEDSELPLYASKILFMACTVLVNLAHFFLRATVADQMTFLATPSSVPPPPRRWPKGK